MTEGTKVPICLFVPVKNEEANLERCLQSISWVDELFVVDSQSTDRTGSIALEHGATIAIRVQGGWPKKNWALENLPLSHEWVLI